MELTATVELQHDDPRVRCLPAKALHQVGAIRDAWDGEIVETGS